MAFVGTDVGQSTLNGTISSGAGTLVVTSAASFPATGVFHILIDSELIRVDSISGTTFTVTRGRGGTSGAAHSDLAPITAVLTWEDLVQLKLDANIPGTAGNYGQTALSGDFTLSSATGVYQDTGLSVALPAAGTYDIQLQTRAAIRWTAGSFADVAAKLYNSTDAADASGASIVTYSFIVNDLHQSQGRIHLPSYTIAAAKTIKLYAAREFDGTLSHSIVSGSSTQDTTITWRRMA